MNYCTALLTTAILALIAFLAPASAWAAVEMNASVPTSLTVFVPCANSGAGEPVMLSGDLHILFAFEVDSSGGLHGKIHFQPQSVSGTGVVTGAKYQGTGVEQDEFTAASSGTSETTYINNFRIIGQGPGNNFLVHETLHLTLKANGDVTAFVDNFSIDCK
ncbi:MAG: hypothetical protein AUH85_02690 [Chloroflexi bacterium 13_1_40CM_4_68_4]|nr:MAG: hypothetical protein AUH85_02690 [Chloroflexi bacterium 13_1_40CM_4_68_4]